MSLLSYYASAPGTSHVALGLPNQDAFAVNHLRGGWTSASVNCDGKVVDSIHGGEFLVAAVADGLGSKAHPDIGSREAASTAVASLSLAIVDRRDLSEVDDLVLSGVLHASLAAVERKAAELGVDPSALATTLAVCAWDGDHVVYAIAGDSGFVARCHDGYHCLGEMARGGSRTTVYPLSACSHWQFGKREGVDGVLLATDGILEQVCPGYVASTDGAGDPDDEVGLALASEQIAAQDAKASSAPEPAEPCAVSGLEMNEPLLDLFLEIPVEDACRPTELTSAAEDFLKSLDPYDVYDDKTVVVLYKTEATEPIAIDPDFYSDEELEALEETEPAGESESVADPVGESEPVVNPAVECEAVASSELGASREPGIACGHVGEGKREAVGEDLRMGAPESESEPVHVPVTIAEPTPTPTPASQMAGTFTIEPTSIPKAPFASGCTPGSAPVPRPPLTSCGPVVSFKFRSTVINRNVPPV